MDISSSCETINEQLMDEFIETAEKEMEVHEP